MGYLLHAKNSKWKKTSTDSGDIPNPTQVCASLYLSTTPYPFPEWRPQGKMFVLHNCSNPGSRHICKIPGRYMLLFLLYISVEKDFHVRSRYIKSRHLRRKKLQHLTILALEKKINRVNIFSVNIEGFISFIYQAHL